MQLLTLGRRVKVQRAPQDDRCPLSSTQSISAHSCLSRWRLWEIVFSGMFGLWSLGVWTWKKSNNNSVAGLTFIFSSCPPNHRPLVFSTFSLVSRIHPTGVEKSSTCGVFLKSASIFLCKHLFLWPNAFLSHGLPWFYSLWISLFCPFQRNYIKM